MPATPPFLPITVQRDRIMISCVSSSALRKRHGDEARRSAALDAHQNAVLVVGARSVDRLAHLSGIGYVLSRDFENDVAFLEATLGRSTLRVNLGDDDAFLAGTGNAVGGCYRQAELRHIGSAGGAALVLIVIVGLGFNRVRQLAKRQVDHLVLALVQHVELHGIAGREAADGAGEFARILDRLAIHRGDHVAGFNAGLGRRTVGLRFRNQRAFGLLEAETVGDVNRDRLNLDTDPAAADRALVLELRNHSLHGRGGNRKRDADAAARRRINRGVDAHDFAFGVEGRAAGIALVHGRVDLDEIIVRPIADIAAAGREDAGGDGAAEAERIADREHPVADPGFALRKLCEREARAAVDLDQRNVAARVGADHLRAVGLAVIGRDFNLVGAIDHVIVGDRITVGGNEEAGALTGHAPMSARAAAQTRRQAIRSAEAAEEALHRGARLERRIIVFIGAIILGDLLVDIDLYRNHRRLHALDNVGKPDRLRDLADFVVDLRMRGAAEDVDRAMRRAEAIEGNPEAGHD